MKEPKFYNKDGSLTRYSFKCGYVQREEHEGEYKEMYMEYNHYHVKSGPIGAKWIIWECFDQELTKARNFYKSISLKDEWPKRKVI